MKRQLGAMFVIALALTGCAGTPDLIGVAAPMPEQTVVVTETTTESVTPPQCRQAIDLAYKIIKDYDDLTQLNIDIMRDMFDEDWDNATMRMERALKDLEPIDQKKIQLAGLGVYC